MFISLLIASTVAIANPARETAIAPAPTPTPAATATVAAGPSPTTRYCVIDTLTGTRIRTKKCLTAAQWIARDGEVPGADTKRR
ncbi:hypothetical protein [uncultured Sphingomonas sp.]|uniref:hypothetical protein n=1 Tax=uncultured Sphingomonas sp. TaxID=158754 RepID=UPI0025D06DDB|nr:hypothetical protein [uncultured Sphingomonas sp.]